jgi:phenylalanyl-tRNA synthetase beta chain
VMRIYGYNNIEVSRSISYTAHNEPKNYNQALENRVGSVLQGFGFSEIMNLSLTSELNYNDSSSLVKVVNPLSNDLNVLRGDMIYSGLETVAYNLNRKNNELKLFEVGKTYHVVPGENGKYNEQKHLSIFVSGPVFKENMYHLDKQADFYFLKATINNLLEKCGITNYKSSESNYAGFDFGLRYEVNGKLVVEFGAVSKKLLKKYDISQSVFYANINWEVLVKLFSKQKIVFEELSKFPSVRRDLALLLDKSVKYQQVEELAYNTEKKLLKDVNLFDVYENEKLGDKKSYAVSFTLINEEATLTDKQIDTVMDKLIKNYKEKLGAELR